MCHGTVTRPRGQPQGEHSVDSPFPSFRNGTLPPASRLAQVAGGGNRTALCTPSRTRTRSPPRHARDAARNRRPVGYRSSNPTCAGNSAAPFCGCAEPGLLCGVKLIEELPDVPGVLATAVSLPVTLGPIARPTHEPHCNDSGVMLRRNRTQRNRSGPGGRNTRSRYRSDAVPREGATFRPFGPFCRRAYPPSAERIQRNRGASHSPAMAEI